jgi:hypothetical protein
VEEAVGSARILRAVPDILSGTPDPVFVGGREEAPQNAERSAQNVRATRKAQRLLFFDYYAILLPPNHLCTGFFHNH